MAYNDFYQAQPLGWGQGANALPLINNLTAEQAALLSKYDPKQIIDGCLYDTKYYVAGTAVNGQDVLFFQQQLAQQDALGNNSAVTFTKQFCDTNMVQSGQLERGTTMIVTSLQAQISIPNNLDQSLQASGNTTQPLITGLAEAAVTATSGALVGGLWHAITEAGYIQLKVGPNRFEEGLLSHFPSEFGASGFNAGVQNGTVVATDIPVIDGIINNGFGIARNFIYPRTILPGQNFNVKLNFYNLFNPSRNFRIRILLRGLLLSDVA
jgi:hypothetical protein